MRQHPKALSNQGASPTEQYEDWAESFIHCARENSKKLRQKFGNEDNAEEFATKAGLSKDKVDRFVRELFPRLRVR